jgi:hypothetical protein
MRKLELLSAAAIVAAAITSPVLAQVGGGPIGPGSRDGLQPQPGPVYYDQNYRPFNDGSYAMMRRDSRYCAQRYRSYDPASGTFMGNDSLRHPCQ